MSCTRVDEIRKSELFYSPEPLQRARLKNTPQHTFDLRPLDIEFDEVV